MGAKDGTRLAVAAAVGACAGLAAFGELAVSKIFASDMVLQRDRALPVWGKASPGADVTVAFGGRTAAARADAKGDWTATFGPFAASREGRTLSVSGEGANVAFTNVLVGDVWLVSGQSNAEMSFSWGILNGKAEMARAKDFPNVRAKKFHHQTSPYPVRFQCAATPWVTCTEATLPNVTAMGYFFAREINARTGIPIGLLDDNWSGCRIEPFVPLEGMKLVGGMDDDVRKATDDAERWLAWVKGAGDPQDRLPPSKITSTWTKQHNAMIAPITRFPIAGALWYQGCSNGRDGAKYAPKLEALIRGWRALWGYDFPFYVVQLSSYHAATATPGGGDGYAPIRDAMRRVVQKTPGTGLAVTVDVGNARDIHPKNKQDVGARLARWARRDVYGEKDLVPSGPLFREMVPEGDGKLRLKFDYAECGLMAATKGPDTPGAEPEPCPIDADKLRGFAVAGVDRKWKFADAEIDGCDVIVFAPEVSKPVAVRYAFRANPMGSCNLYNKAGLPASPFRTDDWPCDFGF